MHASAPWVLLGISLVTAAVTHRAFQDGLLFERLLFRPDNILRKREVYRMFTSALLHVDWFHFLFNFVGLYSFGELLENVYGGAMLLGIYLASVFGGSLLSLFLHRRENYTAVGASAGVCGVIYASIFLLPGGRINLFFIPIGIPDSVYAVGFLILSMVAVRRGDSRVGHDAHIGGAVTGLLTATLLAPATALARPVLWLAVFSVSVAIGVILTRSAGGLLWPKIGPLGKRHFLGEPEYKPSIRYQRYDENAVRRAEEDEMNRLLEQISARGLESLNKRERQRLKELAAARNNTHG